MKLIPQLVLLGSLAVAEISAFAADKEVTFVQSSNKVTVNIGTNLFTEYYFTGAARPYYYPVLGPGEKEMTRNWPMKDTPNEEHDHPHHRSIWYAHSSVNGLDFWTEGKEGRIVHQKFLEIQPGKIGTLVASNNWVDPSDKIILTDRTKFTVYPELSPRMFDFEITLYASQGDVVFGDNKDGTFAMRIAETMRLTQPKTKPGDGHILNSEGLKDDKTWGKRANWVDYSGPVQGSLMGIAMFDYPSNYMHPTWWHVRDYGLFAANPYGVSDFEKKPKGTGNMTLQSGKSITYRYRVIIHEGEMTATALNAAYDAFAKTK